jgi:hypothetical protein
MINPLGIYMKGKGNGKGKIWTLGLQEPYGILEVGGQSLQPD